ncbi:hypothetical protein EOM33_01335 [Candidatus Saccharibacteria bacterium]|nr:hypothetical protein [Candidatus Saccharibacteria bacterium]
MFGNLETWLSSRLGIGVLWIASIVCAYQFGGHVTSDRDSAVSSAVTSLTVQASKALTDSINGQVGAINSRLTGDSHAIDLILNGGLANINAAADRINNLPSAGVWVKSSPDAAGKTPAVNPTNGKPGNNGTYRAELSDEARAFFNGEAQRANVCAVRLSGAQSTIRSWAAAVEQYNRTVADPAGVSRVNLPPDTKKP